MMRDAADPRPPSREDNRAAPTLPIGTVTFLRTDIEGSMEHMRLLGPAYDELNAAHAEIVRAATGQHGGQIVRSEGDAFGEDARLCHLHAVTFGAERPHRAQVTPIRPRRLVLSVAAMTTALMLVAAVAPAGAADPTAGTKADWVTEEVAPGLVHVVNDGVRDLAGWGLTTGRDGSVWLTSHSRYLPLGQREGIDWPDGKSSGVLFEVAPDGLVWVVEDTPDKPFVRVRSFDGDTWKTSRKVFADSLEGWALDVAADGTVWAAWPDQELRDRDRAWIVAHLEADGWHFLDAPYRGHQLVGLTVTDRGEVWVTDLTRGLFHYDDGAWHTPIVDPDVTADGSVRLGPGSDTDQLEGAVGRDGTLWLVHCGLVDDPWEPVYECDAVLRRQDGTWAAWSTPDELRAGFPSVDVAPDGSAWFGSAFPEGSAGLLRFDGVTWSRFLPGRSVLGQGVDFDTDGNTWVTSEPVYADSRRQVTTHVIAPREVGAS